MSTENIDNIDNDELRPEYDLASMKVSRVGKGRLEQYVQLDENDDLLPHYDLDYSKAKPNRFAAAYKKGVTIEIIDKDDDKIHGTSVEQESE